MAVNGADRPAASEYLQVQTTTDSRAEAMELARAAVAARIAACGQVAGPVASTYWWNDEIERAEEWFVFFKLPADRYDQLAAFLTENHSYDEPEIVATPFVAGSASFLNWITDETRPRVLAGGRDVPGKDDRLLVLGAQGADGAGVEQEELAALWWQAEPAGGEHAQHVAVRDQGDISLRQQRGRPLEHPVGPLADLGGGLPGVLGVARDDPV